MSVDISAAGPGTSTDVLLISASNYPALPIYPYAFVQVSAVAARNGLTTERLDLLRTPKHRWKEVLRQALDRTSPRIIGIHLRQVDSIFIWNYAESPLPGAPEVVRNSYWPVDDTEELMALLRALTDVPVMVGGFGFSTQAQALMKRLRPDFGVVGEPDHVMACLDDVLAHRNLGEIANLAYPSGDEYSFGPRVFLPPADHTEYTEAVLDDLLAFYGADRSTGPVSAHVPVEIQRGCPYRCYFCTEPVVKGRQHRIRDLDVVMSDITFLADRGVSRIWLVCSEINIGSNALLFEMAERMRRLNRGRDRPVGWTCYLLPNPALDRDEIRMLLDAHFEPSWNQFASYHDDNLKQTRVPYRARHAIQAQLYWLEEEETYRREHGQPLPPRRLDMFLGNSYATAETVSATLRTVNELGLGERFDDSLITRATRVFDLGDGAIGESAESAYSVGPRGRLDEIDLLYPTFGYPPSLVGELGSNRAVDEFFAYVEETFLSRAFRGTRDWPAFMTRVLSTGTLVPPVAGDAEALLRRILATSSADGDAQDTAAPGDLALTLVELITGTRPERTHAVFQAIGLPGYWEDPSRWSPYDVCSALGQRYDSIADLMRAVDDMAGTEGDSAPQLAVEYCVYANNVVLRPDYARLLFSA
ncbi:B12-binding domain-containing radical SAM protein [Streptomyces sp. NPDC050529]|uniref:B12-binding domain-containing radical SAM protein n=1 Tax=Streptomyces sp. NPDC050529 TaxID=3365624 RepID=UPI00378F7713